MIPFEEGEDFYDIVSSDPPSAKAFWGMGLVIDRHIVDERISCVSNF